MAGFKIPYVGNLNPRRWPDGIHARNFKTARILSHSPTAILVFNMVETHFSRIGARLNSGLNLEKRTY